MTEGKGINPGEEVARGQRNPRRKLAEALLPENVLGTKVTATVDPRPAGRRLGPASPLMSPRPGRIVIRVEDPLGIGRRSELESFERMEVVLHDAGVKLVGAEPLDHGDEIAIRITEGLEPHREILPRPFVLPPDHGSHRLVKGIADHGAPFHWPGPMVPGSRNDARSDPARLRRLGREMGVASA